MNRKLVSFDLSVALIYPLCFIYCVDDLTRLRVYFRAKYRRSSPKISIFLPLARQFLPNETTRGSYQRRRKREGEKASERDLPMYRADTKARNIFPCPAGPSSIKYTPPSLDKLKRRMTVLRRRLCEPSWPTTARAGRERRSTEHMARIK